MDVVTIMAPAKINLAIDVIGKRDDGYHLVEMIMQSISLKDQVELKKNDQGIKIKSNMHNIPLDKNNIVYKTWEIMQDRFSLPGGIEIYLDKKIPVGAGLAGGSTDAAGVLKGINQLYSLGQTNNQLAQIGSLIGADVAFCVFGGMALAEGIGEIITPLPPLPKAWLVLVNPGFGVATKDVYKSLSWLQIKHRPKIELLLEGIKDLSWPKITDQMVNVLEEVTLKKHPVIKEIKADIHKMGLKPLMSGSGPTVFGLTENYELAAEAADYLENRWQTVLMANTVGRDIS